MRQKHPNVKVQLAYGGLTDECGKWTGRVRTVAANLDLPLRVKKPTAWAIWNDLFHEAVPDEFIDRAFSVMTQATRHTYLVLTKRAEGMAEYFLGRKRPAANVWLGVTAENQEQVNIRVPILMSVPAAVRFLSIEPMLGAVDLTSVQFDKHTKMDVLSGCGVSLRAVTQSIPNAFCDPLDWVICGGETGARARPCDPHWVRRLRDDCQAAKVPFFFKGWGGWNPNFGKKDSCCIKYTKRLLDGREWNEV